MLTSINDLDFKILNELEDMDLVSCFMLNKESYNLSKHENFWLNRIMSKYPYISLCVLKEYKRGSWLKYYINDLAQLKFPDSILNTACRIGRLDYALIALNRGANINNDYEPFIQASRNGNPKVVKLLLEAGADVHVSDDLALRFASRRGYYSNNGRAEVVKLLLEAGANVNALYDSALINACLGGCTEVVKILLNNGANVHVIDEEVFQKVSRQGYAEVINLLKDNGLTCYR